jgi:carbon monoxide dehydrogenase subunit G
VVWQAFLNPEVLAKTLPGCEKLEQVDENEYRGVIKVKVGPVQGQFQGSVSLTNLNPPVGYRMQVSGQGPAGFMNGEGDIKLEEQNGATLLQYEGTAQVGGRIASVGQRLIDSSSKALIRQALESLHNQIKAARQAVPPQPQGAPSQPQPASAPAAPAPVPFELEAPSQTQFAFDVAKDVLDDLLPPEKRSTLIAIVLGILAIFLLTEWWINRLAHRVADILEQRR